MRESFYKALEFTVGVEGDYSNDPEDSGGATRFGITEKLAREYGYRGSMKDMPFGIAESVYERHFWKWLNLDAVADISEPVAMELFDSAVHCGRERVAEWFQRLINVLNYGEAFYEDIDVDGDVGPETLRAFRMYKAKRGVEGEVVFIKFLNALQGAHYISLTERRKKDRKFIYGWGKNRL